MIKHTTTIRVRYADTDKMQFVYNGKYFEYFEVGRTEMLRELGLPYAEVEKAGYQLPLIESGARYFTPAHYDDLLEIEACVKELYTPRIHIEYKISRANGGDKIAEGFTTHAFIDIESKKAKRPPKIYIEALAPYFKR